MTRRRAHFTQLDVKRAIKGALSAGIARPRLVIDPEGLMVLTPDDHPVREAMETAAPNPWDEAV